MDIGIDMDIGVGIDIGTDMDIDSDVDIGIDMDIDFDIGIGILSWTFFLFAKNEYKMLTPWLNIWISRFSQPTRLFGRQVGQSGLYPPIWYCYKRKCYY